MVTIPTASADALITSARDYHEKALKLFSGIFYLKDEVHLASITGFFRRYPRADIYNWGGGKLTAGEGELASLVISDVEQQLTS